MFQHIYLSWAEQCDIIRNMLLLLLLLLYLYACDVFVKNM